MFKYLHSNISVLKVIKSNFSGSAKTKLFDKILIANRGEIACRVIRTAKKLGVKTVACYSDADASALHVQLADEAVYIGPSPSTDSYLRGDKIIAAALATKAKAIHPGYGFLSENLNFCKLCRENGIIFIGPPEGAIRAMGSKSESKDIMIKANVPVTPGYHGSDQSNETLLKHAKEIGYPLMIKAVSGGGGKGMRAVFEESSFLEALESCRREGLKSFSDSDVLLEKLVRAPRHVEVQIFGDTHGDAVHILERDCSVQRRHQKVLEEAPAPNLTPSVREAMHNAAVACAKAVGYVGAGTVEFLVDSKTLDFYFCEMNTRLQVEHPVTEMITGIDLVEWQLKVASGQRIPLTQREIIDRADGCAVEARIYAENPEQGFLPVTGQIVHMHTPEYLEPGIRADFGIRSGDSISTFYDPMIAKLIAYDKNRTLAVQKLIRALKSFQVSGLINNIDFLVHCSSHHGFAKDQATTAFFDLYMDNILKDLTSGHKIFDKKAGLNNHGIFGLTAFLNSKKLVTSDSFFPWSTSSSDWRVFGNVSHRIPVLDSNGENGIVYIESHDSNTFQFKVESSNSDSKKKNLSDISFANIVSVENITAENVTSVGSSVWKIAMVIGSIRKNATVSIFNNKSSTVIDVWVDGELGINPTHQQFKIPNPNFVLENASSSNPIVKSPMPGKVIKIVANQGQKVNVGDKIIIIEAMKMEHVISAPCAGTLNLFCTEGLSVNDGSMLAEIENKE